MNVSIYLVSAALEGDRLARNQINDLFEEHKLAKLKFIWNHHKTFSRCIIGNKYNLIFDVVFNSIYNNWELRCPTNCYPYNTNFKSREEAIQFFEQDFLRNLYRDN
jgi:hypothetical protein